MLKIRLQRIGRKNAPSFRLVLTDSRNSTKSGKSIDVLGFHDFQKDGTKLQTEKILSWISKGAQLSDTAHNLLVTNKVITAKKRNVLPKKTYVKPVEEVKAEVKPEPKAEVKAEVKEEAPAPTVEVAVEVAAEVSAPEVSAPEVSAPEATPDATPTEVSA